MALNWVRMKRKSQTATLVLSALLAAGCTGTQWTAHQEAPSDSSTASPAQEATAPEKELVE